MGEPFRRIEDEVDHVHECPIGNCTKDFVGMTPDDMRQHVVEDHAQPLGVLFVFPDEEAQRKYIGGGTNSERGP